MVSWFEPNSKFTAISLDGESSGKEESGCFCLKTNKQELLRKLLPYWSDLSTQVEEVKTIKDTFPLQIRQIRLESVSMREISI